MVPISACNGSGGSGRGLARVGRTAAKTLHVPRNGRSRVPLDALQRQIRPMSGILARGSGERLVKDAGEPGADVFVSAAHPARPNGREVAVVVVLAGDKAEVRPPFLGPGHLRVIADNAVQRDPHRFAARPIRPGLHQPGRRIGVDPVDLSGADSRRNPVAGRISGGISSLIAASRLVSMLNRGRR